MLHISIHLELSICMLANKNINCGNTIKTKSRNNQEEIININVYLISPAKNHPTTKLHGTGM